MAKKKATRRKRDANTELLSSDLTGPFTFDESKGTIKGKPLHRMSQHSVMKERLLALDPNMCHRVPYKGVFETARDRLLAVIRRIKSVQRKAGHVIDFDVYATTDKVFLVCKKPANEPKSKADLEDQLGQ
jgi:hypothetical protein